MLQMRLRPSRGFETRKKDVWFIPGITGRARCLDDVPPTMHQPMHHSVVKRTALSLSLCGSTRQKIVTSAPSSSLDTLRNSSWSWPCPDHTTRRGSTTTTKRASSATRPQLQRNDAGIRSNSLDEHLALFPNSSWLNPHDLDPEQGNMSESYHSCHSKEMNTVGTIELMPLLLMRKPSRHTISHHNLRLHSSTTTSLPLARESPLAIRLRIVLSRIKAATSA